MVDNAGNNECRSGIKGTDLCGPFHRMGFSCGCSKCADARHIKADCKDKGKSLCFRKVCRQDLRDIRGISGCFCTKSRADKIAACSVQGVQDTEQGFFGNCRCTEGKECLPFQSQEHGAFFLVNGFTRPVADMLVRAGDHIENRGFSGAWLSEKSDNWGRIIFVIKTAGSMIMGTVFRCTSLTVTHFSHLLP